MQTEMCEEVSGSGHFSQRLEVNSERVHNSGRQVVWTTNFCKVSSKRLWVISTELASCCNSSIYNFKGVLTLLEIWCAPDINNTNTTI
jgi:hypothetical protein